MIGLVLEGGGARGAFHIGVYRALVELGMTIDGVVGTSIGAINGAMIAQGDGERAWDIWANITNSTIFDIDPKLDEKIRQNGLSFRNIPELVEMVKRLIAQRGIDTTQIREFISQHIDEERVRKSEMDFGLVTVSLTNREPLELMTEDIPEGKLLDYILASASLPGFKTETVDGQKLIDGGVWNNLPTALLEDRGYDTLIAVRTNAIGRVNDTGHFGVRLIEIEPSEDLGPMLDFTGRNELQNLKIGYLDAMRVFKKLRGQRYYLEPHPDKDWAFRKLSEIEPARVAKAGDLLGIPPMSPRRMMFEGIVPKLAMVFQMDGSMDYEDLFLGFYEMVAEKTDLERLEIYSAESFVEIVRERYTFKKLRTSNLFVELAMTDTRLARLVKSNLLQALTDIFL